MKTQFINIQVLMAHSRCGRILLHVIVCARRGNVRWMYHGIYREFQRSSR